MVSVHVLLFPASSFAVYMTRVSPSGKRPGFWCDRSTSGATPELSLNTGSSHSIKASPRKRKVGGDSHWSTVGGWRSTTVTWKLHSAVLPRRSCALYVTVDVPNRKRISLTANPPPPPSALVVLVVDVAVGTAGILIRSGAIPELSLACGVVHE